MSQTPELPGPLAEPARPPARRSKAGAAEGRRSVVFRVLDLIQLVAASPQPMTLAEIGTALKLPKPTVHRLCVRLEEARYLTREPGRHRYRVGSATERLAFNAIRRGSASVQWRLILERLVDDIRETCNFTAPAGNEVIYVERVESRWPLRLHLEVGSRVPMHCTASGKLFLACMDAERRKRMLESLALTRMTDRTITSRDRLEEEIAAVATRGYSTDDEEFILGLVAVAVPVADARGRVVGAVACHAAKARLDLPHALEHLARLRAAAEEIGQTLI
ncbi:MAG TPA: IclR family transcriptional regulator [Dongiaceae bacterium]|nr:IclR family transcriptional regulator [Dongiaceae bacterium]